VRNHPNDGTKVDFISAEFKPMQLLSRAAALLPAILLLCFSSGALADTNKAEAKGSEQKLQAILVWGTDNEKPKNPQHELKDVDPVLKDKFKKIFKWKNYYQIGDTKPFSIRPGETRQLKLSHKCEVKVHQSDKEGMTVELIGEGIPVVKRTQAMPLKDILILAGDDKNATAWFVVLQPK
jgi:hypothetical protein